MASVMTISIVLMKSSIELADLYKRQKLCERKVLKCRENFHGFASSILKLLKLQSHCLSRKQNRKTILLLNVLQLRYVQPPRCMHNTYISTDTRSYITECLWIEKRCANAA